MILSKIGGASEAKVSEKKVRVTDALNALKVAVEEVIVQGDVEMPLITFVLFSYFLAERYQKADLGSI